MNRLFSKPVQPTLRSPRGGPSEPTQRGIFRKTDCNDSIRTDDELADDRSASTKGIRLQHPRRTISDLVLPAESLRQIQQLLSRIRNHDLIYRRWQMERVDPTGGCRTINLYGPPGTGKSMTAEALAAALDSPLIVISYAELESKFVGETPKNIRAAFAEASRTSAVLFFDEADALLGRRLTGVSQSADHAVNLTRAVLLKQLDEFDGVAVFATNLARNFDEAFVRRILLHVEIPLPDDACRMQLWQSFIRHAVPGRDGIDWQQLVTHSCGLSGGEIKNALLIALTELADGFHDGDRLKTDCIVSAICQVTRAKREVGR